MIHLNQCDVFHSPLLDKGKPIVCAVSNDLIVFFAADSKMSVALLGCTLSLN